MFIVLRFVKKNINRILVNFYKINLLFLFRCYFFCMEQTELIRKIVTDYKFKKSNNRSFSLRAYSRYLDINVSILSRIMNGKLPVSENVVKRLVERKVLEQKDYAAFIELKRHKLKYKYDYLDTEDSCISSAFRMLCEGLEIKSIESELYNDDYGIQEIDNVITKFKECFLETNVIDGNVNLKLMIDSDIKANVKLITEKFYEDLLKYIFLKSKKYDQFIELSSHYNLNHTEAKAPV